MAQSLTWIDLSGEWKMAAGDEAAWARPEIDDSSWSTVRLPAVFGQTWQNRTLTWFWLRRTVDLPAGELSLTLGRLVENYEIYLDGVQVARVGDFTARGSQLARPRTFNLSPVAAHRAVLAIRCWRHGIEEPSMYRGFADSGPYLISHPANAPRGVGVNYLQNLRLRRSVDLAQGVALSTLGGILLLIFARQPQRRELLWLGGTCLAFASMRLSTVLSVSEDSYPWQSHSLVVLVPVTTIEFLMAAFRVYSPAARFSALALAACGLFMNTVAFTGALLLFPIVLVWVALRASPRDSAYWTILAACLGVALLGLKATNYLGRFNSWLPFSTLVQVGPYQLNLHTTAWGLTGLLMITTTIQRLLTDSAEKQRLAGEVEAARVVQQLLLPASGGESAASLTGAIYLPAQEVGGDFWHCYDDRLIVVGDVSGKGLKAAMIVSLVTGALANRRSDSPAALLAELNHVLLGKAGFVTCCIVRLEPGGQITVANAGHPAPYLDGHELELSPGLPLGILPDAEYTETTIPFDGQLTLVSDGVIEAANTNGELFGFDRTRALSTQSAQAIADAAQQWGQNDDITVVTVRRNAAA